MLNKTTEPETHADTVSTAIDNLISSGSWHTMLANTMRNYFSFTHDGVPATINDLRPKEPPVSRPACPYQNGVLVHAVLPKCPPFEPYLPPMETCVVANHAYYYDIRHRDDALKDTQEQYRRSISSHCREWPKCEVHNSLLKVTFPNNYPSTAMFVCDCKERLL